MKNTLTSLEKKRFLEITGGFKKARILVIGDFILDQFVWGSVKRISPEAPVPVVKVERESFMPGGSLSAGNAAARAEAGNPIPSKVVTARTVASR